MAKFDDIEPDDNHEIEPYRRADEDELSPIEPVIAETRPLPDRLAEIGAMKVVYSHLLPLPDDGRRRVLLWVLEALEMGDFAPFALPAPTSMSVPDTAPAEGREMSPREFISLKKPTTAVERMACLAYYLTRFRGQRHFKTSDLVALNTEAASPRFAHPSRDLSNADHHSGYVVASTEGAKQITVRGEAVVDALPDREAVRPR